MSIFSYLNSCLNPKDCHRHAVQEFQSEGDRGILFYVRLKLTFGVHPTYIA